jgi:CubicO group peptidase (beta-lactamase class C family)
MEQERGIRDYASGAPVDDDTIVKAQSMSKPVFLYRLPKLAEQGILDMDAPPAFLLLDHLRTPG